MSNVIEFPSRPAANPGPVVEHSVSVELSQVSHEPAPAGFSGRVPGIFFPVTEAPVIVGGQVAAGFKGIVREDTGLVLGIHSMAYKLVRNEDVFPVFEEALHDSGLDLTGMTIKDELSYGGARTHRLYRFPAHKALVDNGDGVDLQLRVINSYDGSAAFSTLVGAFRFLCSNGMVLGDRFAQSYGRHTKGLEPQHMVHQVARTAELFMDETSKWRRWADRIITDQDAAELFQSMPGMNDRLHQKLMDQWHREMGNLGRTMWALFNAATHWSTHEQVRSSSAANRPSIVVDRESRVRSMLNSKEFFKLAA